jgi:hypothetical protein
VEIKGGFLLMPTEFFTLDVLSTIAGMISAIVLFTQFTKGGADFVYNKICSLLKIESDGFPTKLWTVILAEGILFLTMYFNGLITSNLEIFLAGINGLVLAGISMGSYDALQGRTTDVINVDENNTEDVTEDSNINDNTDSNVDSIK